jgi:class 3 adenylate cyclase
VLPKLTSDDLREIGVAAVGHRRKLLDAIAALGAPSPVADASGPPAETTATFAPTSDAERRQLTVMFCNLVGSTPLSARFDPEDLREVIGAYHRTVADVVRSLDGFVGRYMGDGVLIYFGYPRAHEDDAERAVRAGLGLIDAVRRLDVKSVKLQARVGIATGLVVVGDLIGEGAAQDRGVVGETPNLAARLQTLAEPDTVIITAGTRRLVSLATAKSCSSPANQGSASRVSPRHWRSACIPSRTSAYAISAHPIIRTARCSRSLTSWAGRLSSDATTCLQLGWKSWRPCSPALPHRTRIWRFWRIC